MGSGEFLGSGPSHLISSAPMWKRRSVEVRPKTTPSMSRVQGSETKSTRCRERGQTAPKRPEMAPNPAPNRLRGAKIPNLPQNALGFPLILQRGT